MKPRIPSHVVGYTLTSDYCEIQPPNGHGFAFARQHPVRGANGEYDPSAEWCEQFQSRMRDIIRGHGFPILHEQGMKPMEVASTQEPEHDQWFEKHRAQLEAEAAHAELAADYPEEEPPAPGDACCAHGYAKYGRHCPTCQEYGYEGRI